MEVPSPALGVLRRLKPHLLSAGWMVSCASLMGVSSCSGNDEAPGDESQETSDDSDSGGRTESGGSAAGGIPETGGSAANTGGASGGMPASGSGGTPTLACDDSDPLPKGTSFDCGELGQVLLDSGPPENRVNYVIAGDGYTESQLDSVYLEHVSNMLEHEQGMFGDFGEPYRTYRRFLNICALKIASQDGCVDDRDTNLQCDTAFDGYGDDASRLGIVSEQKVYAALADALPASLEVDWIGVTIHAGEENWWNSGGAVMVWNGGFGPREASASVALHEGGHAFHGLADEYDGTSTNCGSAPELNVSTDDAGEKWKEWLGFDHTPGTGLHGSFEGGRYCSMGIYRPTDNSEMNQLPDYFNMPSIQKIIHDIYEIVDPIDAHTENTEPLVDASELHVRVIDPEVLSLEWTVDGEVDPDQTGSCYSLEGLEPGDHTIEVLAFDDTPWIRDRRDDLQQTVTWQVKVAAP